MITKQGVKDDILDGFLTYIYENCEDSSDAIFSTEEEANKEAEIWNSVFRELSERRNIRAEVYSKKVLEVSRNSKFAKKIKKYGWIILED